MGAFDVIGEGSLTDAGHKRGATVVAASPSVKALSLSRQTFDDLVSRGTIDSSVQRELHRRINHWKTEKTLYDIDPNLVPLQQADVESAVHELKNYLEQLTGAEL